MFMVFVIALGILTGLVAMLLGGLAIFRNVVKNNQPKDPNEPK
jgi:hypothetical protein